MTHKLNWCWARPSKPLQPASCRVGESLLLCSIRRCVFLLALCLPLLAEEPKVHECESLKMEIQLLKTRIARLQIEDEISRNPLVMRIRLAEAEADAKYEEAKKKEEVKK